MANYLGVSSDVATPASVTFQGAGSTTLTAMYKITQSLAPASVAANTTAEQTFTVPGLAVGDYVHGNKPTFQAGLGTSGYRVSAANTLAITYVNATASPIVPATENYVIFGCR